MPKIKPLDIVLVILATVFLGGSGYAWYYFYQQDQTLDAKIIQQKTEINVALQKIKQLQEFRMKSAEFENEQKRMAAYIPNREEQAKFVIELEKLGERCHINLKSCILNPEPVRNPSLPDYIFFLWKVNISGDYQGLLSFLDELPKANRMVTVSEIFTTASLDQAKESYKLDVAMTLQLVANAPVPEKVKQ